MQEVEEGIKETVLPKLVTALAVIKHIEVLKKTPWSSEIW